jgi:hypothetical protein
VAREPLPRCPRTVLRVPVHLLALHGAPQPFDEHVVRRPPTPSHADADVPGLELVELRLAGAVAALVAVPYLGRGLRQRAGHRRHDAAAPQ